MEREQPSLKQRAQIFYMQPALEGSTATCNLLPLGLDTDFASITLEGYFKDSNAPMLSTWLEMTPSLCKSSLQGLDVTVKSASKTAQ
jgi:hypothetical protein